MGNHVSFSSIENSIEYAESDIRELRADVSNLTEKTDKNIKDIFEIIELQCDANDTIVDALKHHKSLLIALASASLSILSLLKNRDNPHWSTLNYETTKNLELVLKDITNLGLPN